MRDGHRVVVGYNFVGCVKRRGFAVLDEKQPISMMGKTAFQKNLLRNIPALRLVRAAH